MHARGKPTDLGIFKTEIFFRSHMGLLRTEMEISSAEISDDAKLPGWHLYHDETHPSAITRAQQRLEIPWILEKIRRHIGYRASILDMGCGFGHATNEFARKGHNVTGVDCDQEVIEAAKYWDDTQSVQYRLADIHQLPFTNKSFDVVTALDILYRIDQYPAALQEAERVLKPGGIFIFNNFNHTPWAWLLAVKGPEWFIKNTPAEYNTFARFQKPYSLARQLKRVGLDPLQICGFSPVLMQSSLLRLLYSGAVNEKFQFRFCKHPWLGYVGIAKKRKFYT